MNRADMVTETRQLARELGHTLTPFRFRAPENAATAACSVCDLTVLVIFSESRAVGAAVTLPCQTGEERTPLPPVKVPPSGHAKPLPRPAPAPVRGPALVPLHVPPSAVLR